MDGSPTPRRIRPRAVAGVVLFLYALWWSGSLALAGFSRSAFTSTQRAYAGVAGRVVLGLVVLAALFHVLDGIGRILGGGDRAAEDPPPWVHFLTWALGLPAALVILWPSITGWLA